MLTCTFEDGARAKLRHVTVDAFVLNDDRTKVLLVKRAAGMLEAGKWGNVGGYMERDETLIECMEREVMEETGYRVHDAKLLTIRDNPDRPAEDRQNVAVVFICRAGELIGKPDHESDEVRWFELSTLPSDAEMAFDHASNLKLLQQFLVGEIQAPLLTY